MPDKDHCRVCGNEIKIQIRKHTGLCCENCEKRDNATTDKG